MSRLSRQCLTFLPATPRWGTYSKFRARFCCRRYATHKDYSPSSLLSQQFEQQRRSAQAVESVGPFQLGIAQTPSGNLKKWSELSTGGKVLRTTARTTNITVILFGAGLSAVLAYVLASELFAKNSPTVLYGDACERIRESPLITKYLKAPLTFHNNPPSSLRPRHRNRRVNSLLAVDSSGREHLLLNFYIQGSESTASQPSDADTDTYGWINSKVASISKLTLDDAITWCTISICDAIQASRRVFAYLTGNPLPPLPQPPPPPNGDLDDRTRNSESSLWSVSGLFTRLTGRRRSSVGQRGADAERRWSTGEVHADFVKDAKGEFVYRYLIVDIPDSSVRNPSRLYVERADDLRDGEAMVRWTSS